MSVQSNALSTLSTMVGRMTRASTKAAKPTKRARTPTRIQMEAVECGAAALAIVLEYYGLVVPLEEVRVACGVSRDGSKAKNILIAARQYGFKAQGYKRSIDRLKTRKMPAIIFWNFNHFVVLEGFGKGKVFINDPARGPRVVSDEEFDESFTGVTLELEPGPTFKRGGQRPSLFTGLKTRLAGSRSALAFVILASLWVTLLGLIVPSFTRVFVDRVLIEGLTSWVGPLFGVMAGVAVMIGALTLLQQHFLLRMETKLATSTSAQFLWHVLKLPIDFFNQRRAADISVRVTINDRIAQLLSGEVATNLIRLLLVAFYVVVMLQYDVLLTVLGAVMALVNIVALRTVSRKRVDASQRLLTEQGKFTATALNGLQTVETLKATGTESDFFARWAGYQAQALSAEQDLSVYTELLSAIPPTLLTITNALVLAVGGLRVIGGQLSMGELVAFQALIIAFLVPVNGLIFLGDRLQLTTGDMTRIDDVMRYPLAEDAQSMTLAHADASAKVAKLKGYVEIRGLTFGYNRLDPPLVENFDLSLKPGMRVALVGGSGSGKSTIAKLVAGVYEAWSGEILFDGKTRADVPRAELKHSLAMVDQDIYLLEGTIRENIAMWDETVPEANVIQAAKDAAIHNDIAKRPSGYYDRVLEGGTNFSGGQRQRLEIARALANDPSILIMDEATSALDPVTEKIIDENLRRRGCTCLIVAHRLSTIRDCDEIIVMERGKVVQRGTHERMIREDGPYARLIKMDESSGAKSKNVFDMILQS